MPGRPGFGKVFYHNDYQRSGRPSFNELAVGTGFEGLEVTDKFWELIDSVDAIVFPDCYDGGLQQYLRAQGYPVWGSGKGGELEIYRGYWKEVIAALGLTVAHYEYIEGLDALADYLREHDDCYIKISRMRGLMETRKHIDYELSLPWLNKMRYHLGPLAEETDFIVEQKIDTELEIAGDTIFAGGQFPNLAINGCEQKDCYDSETEVMTNYGWKLFRHLDGSEQFLTLKQIDVAHSKLEYQSATAFIRDDYEGKMLSVENRNMSLLVTPNHKLLIQLNSQDHNRKSTVKWKSFDGKMREFKQGTRRRTLVRVTDIDLKKQFCMPWPSGAYYWGRRRGINYFQFGNVRIPLIKFSKFLGIYLSEGWSNGYRISISQKKHCKAMESVLKECGLRYSISHCYGVQKEFAVSNRPLAEYLYQFGKSADKHMPEWLKMSGWKTLRHFIYWYSLGDGHHRMCEKQTRGKRRKRMSRTIYTISKRMANDLQEAFAKCGIQSLIAQETANGKPRYRVMEHSVHRRNYVLPNHSKWVDYKGEIFCVTVPNHIILVRRNGKPMWCGNSSYAGMVQAYSDLPEQIQHVNAKLAPILAKYRYSNMFAVELRIDKEGNAHPIDPCCRQSSPAGEAQLSVWSNFPEVVYAGARGQLVQPEFENPYVLQAMIYTKDDEREWLAVRCPEDVRESLNLYFGMRRGRLDWRVPQPNPFEELGSITVTGGSFEEAKEKLEAIAERIEGDVCIKTDSIDDAIKEFDLMKKKGMSVIPVE